MSQLVIYKNESGKLEGFGEKGRRAALSTTGSSSSSWLDWLKVGAGHVDLVPGRDGVMVAWKYRGAAA